MSRYSTRLTISAVALALVAAACTGGGSPDGGDAAEVPAGDPAPTTAFVRFDGSSATFADYAGTPLVVNWWASWCPSCVAEMSAAFKPAQEALGDRVTFVGMNLQDERSKAEELVAETGVLFELAEDPDGTLYVELGGLGMPFTIFIGADGNVVEEHNGPLSEQQLVDMIEELLLS